MKRILIVFAAVLAVFLSLSLSAKAASQDTAFATEPSDQIYDGQMHQSGADELYGMLPGDTQKSLQKVGVDSLDWRQLNALNFSSIFSAIMSIAGQQGITPFNSMSHVLAIIILCALLQSFKTSFSSAPLGGMLGEISTICICAVLIYPISVTISTAAAVINSSASFILLFVPVMVGIMISSGQAVTGASYYSVMMCAGNVVAQTASGLLVPLLNVFLGISVVGTVSSKINLKVVCALIEKVVKWILTFAMSVFVTLLTMQTFIGSSADSTGVRAARFAISSFVPLVGGALSEAFQTVQGCLKLLKSGVG